jgi:diadenosine tetraphosphate (Ap4A) HIT family hydrolase
MEYERVPFDVEGYEARTQRRPCFICAIVTGTHDVPEHLVYRDEFAIAFMNQFPPLVGYVLVAPTEHRERWELDFTEPEHLRMHALIRRIGRAVTAVLPTERIYLLSLGSQQGNAHVHWHVAPLPPGVPYEQQQGEALSLRHGYLRIPHSDYAQLAALITSALQTTD